MEYLVGPLQSEPQRQVGDEVAQHPPHCDVVVIGHMSASLLLLCGGDDGAGSFTLWPAASNSDEGGDFIFGKNTVCFDAPIPRRH